MKFANQLEEINKLKAQINRQEVSTLQLKKALSTQELSNAFQDEKENKRRSQEILIKKYKEEIARVVHENHRLLLQYNECNTKLENNNSYIVNIKGTIELFIKQLKNFNVKVNEQLVQISPLVDRVREKLSAMLEETAVNSLKFIDMTNYNKREDLTEKQKDYTRLIEAFKKEIESVEVENSVKFFELMKLNQTKTQNLKRCIIECRKLKIKLEKVTEERNKLNKDIKELKAKQVTNTEFNS
jgi:hypothetical protein